MTRPPRTYLSERQRDLQRATVNLWLVALLWVVFLLAAVYFERNPSLLADLFLLESS